MALRSRDSRRLLGRSRSGGVVVCDRGVREMMLEVLWWVLLGALVIGWSYLVSLVVKGRKK